MLLSNFTAANVTDLIGDITAANSAGGNNTITLVANSSFTLSQVNNTTNGANGLPVITSGDNLTIIGNGDTIARSGSTAFRLLSVASGASLTLENLTLSGGLAFGGGRSGAGGALLNQGNLTLQGVTVKDNTAQGSNGANASGGGNVGVVGGGIFSSSGSLSLLDGTIVEDNKVIGINGGNGTAGAKNAHDGGGAFGGGVFISGSTVTLSNTTISGNTVQGGNGGNGFSSTGGHPGGEGGSGGLGEGGGLFINASSVTLVADTLGNNVAHGGNGGNGGFNDVSHGNGQAGGNGGNGAGGGVYVSAGSVTLSRDLVAGNMAKGGDGGNGSNGSRKQANGSVSLAQTAGNGGNGGAATGGGLFVSKGNMTLTQSALTTNAADGGNGGNGGNGNSNGNGGNGGNVSGGAGGALSIAGGSAMLIQDTLAGNSTLGGSGGKGGGGHNPGNSGFGNFSAAGGIDLENTSNAAITDTTIAGNTATQNGGGILDNSTGTVALLDDTITANSATNGGGVFTSETTGLTLQNTLVAGNSATINGPDVDFGNLTVSGVDLGGNLIGISGPNSGNSGFTAATTQTGTVAAPLNPLLGSLQYNGGPLVGASGQQIGLQTEALLLGSPAIGKGVLNGVTTDERNIDRLVNDHTDVGAFQFQDAALTVAVTPSTSSVAVNGSETFTITVTNTGGNALPADNATLTVTLPNGLTTTGPLLFPLGSLVSGQSQSFTVNTTATMPGTQILTASLTSPDTNPSTASGSAPVTVLANTPPPISTPPPITHTPVGGLTLFGFGLGPTGLDLFEVDGQGDVFAQAFGSAGMSGAPQFVAADAVFRNLALMNGAIVADLMGGNGQAFLMEVLNFTNPFVFHGLLNALLAGR